MTTFIPSLVVVSGQLCPCGLVLLHIRGIDNMTSEQPGRAVPWGALLCSSRLVTPVKWLSVVAVLPIGYCWGHSSHVHMS